MTYGPSEKFHKDDYKENAWMNYSYQELADWIHLLVKRAGHRSNSTKLNKDLYDAQNYLDMLKSKFIQESTVLMEEFNRGEVA